MRRIDKALQSFREPVIAPCLFIGTVHALLNDDPFGVIRHDEAVQIEVEPILHGGAIDLGNEPARLG